MKNPNAPDEGKETARIEAFSDGVFAIAITLLVLDLKVPRASEIGSRALLPVLARQWPTFLAYGTSFATILVMWVNHHKMFSHIRRTNDAFLLLNGLLLLFITFVPFPTSLLAEHLWGPQGRVAAGIYAGTYVLLALVFNALWAYASNAGRLLEPGTDAAQVHAIARQYRTGPFLYLLAFGLAFASAAASFAMCLLLAIYFSFTGAIAIFHRPPP